MVLVAEEPVGDAYAGIHSGDYGSAEVAELFGVGRSTVYRAIERQRNEAHGSIDHSIAKP